jgi:RNA polymerase sigma-70 factor (ECF subfamily)
MAETAVRSADHIEERLIAAAREGDHEAFRRLTEPFYRELHVHCYRMVGSFHDAEDLVQETFLRAWRGIDTFEGRASFRAWLYRISTNECLKEIGRRPSRVLPQDFGPPADPELPPSRPVADVVRLEPYPDVLLGQLHGGAPDPEALYDLKESVELAFLAVIQLLPPRQRAVLILRDVLGWRAIDVADLLDSSVASVNSALQRARGTLATGLPPAGQEAAHPGAADAVETSILARYMRAWEEGDMNALAAILSQDAVLTMPPAPTWFEGRQAIAAFFHSLCFSGQPKRFRMVPTGANGQPACAAYQWDADEGHYRFSGIMVLRIQGDLVAEITGFGDPGSFSSFGLPEHLGAGAAS